MPYIATLLACLGAWAGFANPVFQVPYLVFLFPAGIALTAISAPNAKSAFRRALIAAALAYGGAMYWIALPVHDYGELPWIMAAPCAMLLGVYCALYPAIFGVGVREVSRRLGWLPTSIFAACLWAAGETLRGVLFSGFPWLNLSSAFTNTPWLLQGASIVGAEGLAGIVAGIATAFVVGRGQKRAFVAPLAALVLLGAFGFYRLEQPIANDAEINVALVQGNIDQAQKWNSAFQTKTVDRYITLTTGNDETHRQGVDLFVWPETALPFYFQETSLMTSRVRKAAKDTGAYLLTGAPAYTPNPGGDGYRMHNRAFLVAPDGTTAGFYDKEHLVPFGEYLPLSDVFSFIEKFPFLEGLTQGIGYFEPGISSHPLDAGPMDIGVLICYETIFPALAQARVEAGANILVNISNDAWFGRSSAPFQHLEMSALRAVEQGRWLVRGTNTGISAVIDPYGRIVSHGGLFRAETITAKGVGLTSALTPYHRVRGYLEGAVAVAVLIIGFMARQAPIRRRIHVLD